MRCKMSVIDKIKESFDQVMRMMREKNKNKEEEEQ